jgi:hypothetical protein
MRRILLLLVFVAACDKRSVQECDTGCRNYAKLHFWHLAEAQINAVPADQRDALRKEKEQMFEEELDKGIDLCVNGCTSAATKSRVQCWVNARTYDELMKCDKT